MPLIHPVEAQTSPEKIDTSKRELPYATDIHKQVRSSPSMTKALAFAFALHAGGGLGLAYGKDAVQKGQEVYADIQHQLETRFEPIQHSPERLRVAQKALFEQEGETYQSGTFILAAEALDEDLDGRRVNHELPRQRYAELQQHVRTHLAEMHAGDHPTIDQVREAIAQSTRELGYNYQGVGGTLMSDLLRYRSGSCKQISLLVASLAHDVGHLQDISLRTYAPKEVHDARGTHITLGHVAPIVMRDTPRGRVAFDLVTNRVAVHSTADTPLERLPRRFLYPHMHYTDASGNVTERSANASSINTFHLPTEENDPYEGGAPFFSTGLMESNPTPVLTPPTSSSFESSFRQGGARTGGNEQDPIVEEQSQAQREHTDQRLRLSEHVADDWWRLAPPAERTITTYRTENLTWFDTSGAPVPEAPTAPPPEQTPGDISTNHSDSANASSTIESLERVRSIVSQTPGTNLQALDARLLMQWRLAEAAATREHNPLAAHHARQQREAVQARFSQEDINGLIQRINAGRLDITETTLEGTVFALSDRPDIQRALRNQLEQATPNTIAHSRLVIDMLRIRHTQGMALEAINRLSPEQQYYVARQLHVDVSEELHGDTRFVRMAQLNAFIEDGKIDVARNVFGEHDGDGDTEKDEGDLVSESTEGYQEQLSQLQAFEQRLPQSPAFRQATEGATPEEIAALQTAIHDEIMFQR